MMGMLWPTLEFILGISMVITLLAGGHQVLAHRINVGAIRGVQHLHDHVDLAHHRRGLGDQHLPSAAQLR
ncbi:MAG: hypothetical protein WDM87_09245 [Terracidiphilus sp.]